MQRIHSTRLGAAAAFVALALAAAAPAGAAGPITVQVNGGTVNLTPPPTERAGRVFVPLRGVFENLGATVVYAGGEINATDHRHTIQLHVGSNDAVVDGQHQTLDVAPFIVGASTFVPLRFISQALGAHVNWDENNALVAITTDRDGAMGNAGAPNMVVTPAPHMDDRAIRLGDVTPGRDAIVPERRPQIRAAFDRAVDPRSLRVWIDDVDVTRDATRSPHDVSLQTMVPLRAGRHTVRISGNGDDGAPFDRSWSFSVQPQ